MKKSTAVHNTFVIERDIKAPVERVFQAFADPEQKSKWFKGPPDWYQGSKKFDFRVGGREHDEGGPKGEWVSRFDSYYYDIIPNQRIVYTYEMHIDDRKLSVSLATIEFVKSDKGCLLTLTEQGVYLDGHDSAKGREEGTIGLIDALEKSLL